MADALTCPPLLSLDESCARVISTFPDSAPLLLGEKPLRELAATRVWMESDFYRVQDGTNARITVAPGPSKELNL